MSAAFRWLLTPSLTAGDDASALMPPPGSGSAGDDGADEPLPHARAWMPGDYAWDSQAMVAAETTPAQLGSASSGAAAAGGPRHESVRTCEVAGCAQLLTGAVHGKEYNRRYRLCQLHLRSAEVVLAGVASRWCQTCSRWQPLSAFAGTKRSCAEQLLALSARRRARTAARRRQARAAAAAAATAPPTLEEADLLDWLFSDAAAAPPQLPPPQSLSRPAALFADLLVGSPPAPAVPPPAPPPGPPRPVSVALKLPHATPAQLPPSLAPALGAWADEPLSLFALAQPGCTLLTVDVLLHGDASTLHASAAHAPAARAALAAVLRGCEAHPCGAMHGADVAIALEDDQDVGRAPPLAACSVVALAGAASLTATFAAPVAAAALRCRAHGAALALTQAGACGLAVALPPGFAHGLLLFDLAQPGGGAPLRLARPRALLATRDGGVADELAAADVGDLWLLGAALHGTSGASDAAPELLAAAATTAARRGWQAALASLLPAVLALPPDWRRGLLAAAAGGARPDAAVRVLLRAAGAAWPFGAPAEGGLHAAALACSSRDAGRAAAAAAAAQALTAHGDGALAWHAAARPLPAGCAGGGLWTPAQLAARAAGCAPAAALCAALDGRVAAAHDMLAAAAASLPPAAAAPPAAARQALLAAAPPRLAPGAEAEAASEQARVADLATAMLADADAAARACAPHGGLRSALRRAAACVSPARRQLVQRLLCALVNLPALWLLAALLVVRRPAATADEFRAAAAAGAVPLRFWLPSRGLDVAALLRPVAAAAAAACLAPEAAVAALLVWSDHIEAALVTFASAFILLVLHSDAMLLPGWRQPGQPPVVWEFAASGVQLLISGSTALRARAWAPHLAAFALAARAAMLLAAAAAAGHAVPLTRHSGAVVMLQQVTLLGLAAARAGAARATRRGAHNRPGPKAAVLT